MTPSRARGEVEPRRPDHEAKPAGGQLGVTMEVTTWVSKYVGGDGAGSRIFEEVARPGDTVRDVLRRYSARFPDLDAALWGPGKANLGEHIEVLVNDAVLGVSHDLDTPVLGGERITLLGQFMGG